MADTLLLVVSGEGDDHGLQLYTVTVLRASVQLPTSVITCLRCS